MAQRGRKSLAATSAVSLPVLAESRLQPSLHLSELGERAAQFDHVV
ncbi:hypothetical protein [Atlantibacter hermannii]|nr:hypothetical protein [Atlantibacter hermannii]